MPVGAGAIRAGRAFVEILADSTHLQRGLRVAQKKLQAFGAMVTNVGQQFALLGVAVAAPLVASTFAFAKAGDQLDKMSKRTGVSVESLSALGFAAEQSGSSLDSVERGLRGMQRQLLQAERGSAAVTDALGKLGLSFDDLGGKSTEEQFLILADRLSQIENESEMAGVAMQIFGRAGAELVPLLREGKGGIEELMARAEELGITLTTEQAQAAAEFTDAWNEVTQQLRMVVIQIGGALAPMLTELRDYITPVVRSVIDWIKANPQLVRTILIAAGAVTGLGVALIVVGQVLIGLGAVVGAVATAWGLLTAAIGALFTPVGLVVAAIAAAGVAFFKFTETGRETADGIKGFFAKAFGEIAGDVKTAIGGIGDAIAAGDLKLAAEIAMTAIQLVFQRGLDKIRGLWMDLKDWFAGIIDQMAIVWTAFVGEVEKRAAQLGLIKNVKKGSNKLVGFDERLKPKFVPSREDDPVQVVADDAARRAREREKRRDGVEPSPEIAALESRLAILSSRATLAALTVRANRKKDDDEGSLGFDASAATQLRGARAEAISVSSSTGLSALVDVFRGAQAGSVEEQQLDTLKRIERNTDRRVAAASPPSGRG